MELAIIGTDLLWAMEQEVRDISLKWIGHTIRKPVDSIARQPVTTGESRRPIWTQTLYTPGDNWLRIGVLGRVMLATYTPEGL